MKKAFALLALLFLVPQVKASDDDYIYIARAKASLICESTIAPEGLQWQCENNTVKLVKADPTAPSFTCTVNGKTYENCLCGPGCSIGTCKPKSAPAGYKWQCNDTGCRLIKVTDCPCGENCQCKGCQCEPVAAKSWVHWNNRWWELSEYNKMVAQCSVSSGQSYPVASFGGFSGQSFGTRSPVMMGRGMGFSGGCSGGG